MDIYNCIMVIRKHRELWISTIELNISITELWVFITLLWMPITQAWVCMIKFLMNSHNWFMVIHNSIIDILVIGLIRGWLSVLPNTSRCSQCTVVCPHHTGFLILDRYRPTKNYRLPNITKGGCLILNTVISKLLNIIIIFLVTHNKKNILRNEIAQDRRSRVKITRLPGDTVT